MLFALPFYSVRDAVTSRSGEYASYPIRNPVKSLGGNRYRTETLQQEPPMTLAPDPKPILFFDGVCGLCNRFIDFVLKHDRHGRVCVAPLQGATAAASLPEEIVRGLDTVVLLDGESWHTRSSAIVRIFWKIGGPWSILGTLLWLIPKPLRDLGYKIVARSRYRLFGKKETCRLPTPAERARFLD